MCSLLGASLELAMEVVFSPIGYYLSKKWKKEKVGQDYFDYIEKNKNIEKEEKDEDINNRDK